MIFSSCGRFAGYSRTSIHTTTRVLPDNSTKSFDPTRPTLATRTVGGHVSLGGATRGVQRGNKPAPMKLGARKLNPGDIDLESMLN